MSEKISLDSSDIKYIIMERIVRILNIKWNLKEEQNLR